MIKDDLKKILITEEEIRERCKQLARQIDEDYKDKDVLVVGILKGSVPFMAELIKYIESDIEIDFMAVSSYQGTESMGDLKINKDLDNSIVGKNLLLVEDIIDTGFTIQQLKQPKANR